MKLILQAQDLDTVEYYTFDAKDIKFEHFRTSVKAAIFVCGSAEYCHPFTNESKIIKADGYADKNTVMWLKGFMAGL